MLTTSFWPMSCATEGPAAPGVGVAVGWIVAGAEADTIGVGTAVACADPLAGTRTCVGIRPLQATTTSEAASTRQEVLIAYLTSGVVVPFNDDVAAQIRGPPSWRSRAGRYGMTRPAGGTWKATIVATHIGLGAGLGPVAGWSPSETAATLSDHAAPPAILRRVRSCSGVTLLRLESRSPMRNAVTALVGLFILLAVFAFLFEATASQM